MLDAMFAEGVSEPRHGYKAVCAAEVMGGNIPVRPEDIKTDGSRQRKKHAPLSQPTMYRPRDLFAITARDRSPSAACQPIPSSFYA